MTDDKFCVYCTYLKYVQNSNPQGVSINSLVQKKIAVSLNCCLKKASLCSIHNNFYIINERCTILQVMLKTIDNWQSLAAQASMVCHIFSRDANRKLTLPSINDYMVVSTHVHGSWPLLL